MQYRISEIVVVDLGHYSDHFITGEIVGINPVANKYLVDLGEGNPTWFNALYLSEYKSLR